MDNWKFLLDTINTIQKDEEEHLAMILVALAYIMDEKGQREAEGRLLDLARMLRGKAVVGL